MLTCPNVLALSDEDLLGLIYEEETFPQPEQDHLASCSICKQRLATYTSLNRALHSKLHRRLCPDAGRLNYYCLGFVKPEERLSIAEHLLDCNYCSEEVSKIRSEQARFEAFPETPFSLLRNLPRLFALPVTPSLSLATREGKEKTGWPRQFQAGLLNLSLHLSRQTSGEAMLLGIITSNDPNETVDAFEGISIDLYASPDFATPTNDEMGELILSTQVDDIGNLVLAPVPSGEYMMIIQLPDKEIVIDKLKIEHS